MLVTISCFARLRVTCLASALPTEPKQIPTLVIDYDEERPIRRLRHIADAATHEHALFDGDSLLAIQLQSDQRLRGETSDEKTAAPGREHRTRIEQRARWRDHRRPGANRCGNIPPRRVVGNGRTGVIVAVADVRPPVVLAALIQVELVTAASSHIQRPEPSR